MLKWQDIDIFEAVSKALGPLLDSTDALSSENEVTVSYLKPILYLFSSELLQEKDYSDLKTIKTSVLDFSGYDDQIQRSTKQHFLIRAFAHST